MGTTGNMLRLARQLRGLQQGEAAAGLGVLNVELSRIETGLKEPTEALLQAATTLFKLPLTFFGQTDTVYGAPVSVHPMWRKKTDVPAPEGVHVERRGGVLHEGGGSLPTRRRGRGTRRGRGASAATRSSP